MSWLNNYVRPKIRALVTRKEGAERLWQKCPECDQMIFHRELETKLYVCPHCDHHMRLPVRARLESLFDDGAFDRIELPEVAEDPLKFRDTKRYADRLKEARAKTGEVDAAAVAHGKIGGRQVVVCVLDFSFMGGSMGSAVGEAIVAAAQLAVWQRAPLVVFPASGGARMQEGILSLMQMPRTTVAVNEVREAGLPYIAVLTNPTTGGVTASFAMLGDITLAEPGALIGFAGPRVIENTIRERLPEGFQRSEYLVEHGMIDRVVHRHEMTETLSKLMNLLLDTRPSAEVVDLMETTLEIPENATAAAAETVVEAPEAETETPADNPASEDGPSSPT